MENVYASDFLTGIQVTHWTNQIRNCKLRDCGIGIQLSGKPFVRNVTVKSVSGSDPWTLTLSSSYPDLYAGQYLWQGSDKWLIISVVGGNQITVESVPGGSGAPSAVSSDIYYIDYTDKANSGGPTNGSTECNICTILGCQVYESVKYGIYVKGMQNALINTTIEWYYGTANTSVGVFVAEGSKGISIKSCYFEKNDTHIELDDNVRGTKIIGNLVIYRPTSASETWIAYGTDTDEPDYGNTDFETTKYNADDTSYEFISSIMDEKVGIGTTSPDTKLHVDGAITLGSSGGPQIISGEGAPSAPLPNGSLYLRIDGTYPNLYVRENGSWVSK